jgi:hypothetical protein
MIGVETVVALHEEVVSTTSAVFRIWKTQMCDYDSITTIRPPPHRRLALGAHRVLMVEVRHGEPVFGLLRIAAIQKSPPILVDSCAALSMS